MVQNFPQSRCSPCQYSTTVWLYQGYVDDLSKSKHKHKMLSMRKRLFEEHKAAPTLVRVETFTDGQISLCRVTFSNGLEGFGQLGNKDPDFSSEMLHRRVAPALAGLSLTETAMGLFTSSTSMMSPLMERVLKFELNYKQMGVQLSKAVAGVDSAVWDALAKQLGVPACDLWRELFFDHQSDDAVASVPVYASSIARNAGTDVLCKEFGDLFTKHGIRRFKMKIGERMRGERLDNREVREIKDQVIEVCSAMKKVCPDVRMAFDANGAFYSLEDVDRIFSGVETTVKPWFVEEPVPWYRSTLSRPHGEYLLAGGEQEFRADVWEYAMNQSVFDVYQPDFGYSGGPSSVLLIARAVYRQNSSRKKYFAPHSPQNDFHPVFSFHLLASLPREMSDAIGMELACVDDGVQQIALDEHGRFQPRFADGKCGTLVVKEGRLTMENVTRLKGWGVDVDTKFLSKMEHRVFDLTVEQSQTNQKRSFL